MARLNSLNARFQSPARGPCASRLRLVVFATATLLQRREPGRESSTHASRDTRSRESLLRSAQASPDGQPARRSESAGTADTADIAILAVAVTSLPAKSPPKFLESLPT